MKKIDIKELRSKIIDWFKDVKILIKENKKIAFVILGFIALVVVAIVLTSVFAKKTQTVDTVLSTEDADEGDGYAISDEPLEVDAYPEINSLMKKYYQAVADGDVDTIRSIKTAVDDKESIVIKKKSKYIDDYEVITCYTKKGPSEDTYLVFAYYEVKIDGFEVLAPGLNAWYVCRDDNGNLYINDDEQDEKLSEYCKIISVQDDVVDLNNTVNVKFNELLEANAGFADFMTTLPDTLTAEVGEELAKVEAGIEEEESSEPETVAETDELVERKAKANTVVNVRSSDSGTADKVGTAGAGEVFVLLEEKVNGWSKIEFDGKEAYIKSEYLDVIGEEKSSDDSDSSDDRDSEEKAADSPSQGKAKVSTTVKLRKDASTSSEQLDVIYGGASVDIIEKKSNGWTKIKFSGKTGYVKSEYLE